MTKVSFAVHTWNEADALRRLVLSSLPLAGLFHEWVIVDHRSDDHTQDVIQELLPQINKVGISLKTLLESRDLSATFTFADIRNRAVNACSHPIVVIHDADFILGPRYAEFLRKAVPRLALLPNPYYGATYAVPVIWDRLTVNDKGVIEDHGRIWVHNRKPRILDRRAMKYSQTGQRGRWERPTMLTKDRIQKLPLTPGRLGLVPHTCVSVNVKPAARIELRDTMTLFMQDAVQGKVKGGWLENYAKGKARKQDAYPYMDVDLRGWKLYGGALELPRAA